MTRLIRENGIEATVIELNVDTVRQLRQDDIAAVYGDVTQRETLIGAGVATAYGASTRDRLSGVFRRVL